MIGADPGAGRLSPWSTAGEYLRAVGADWRQVDTDVAWSDALGDPVYAFRTDPESGDEVVVRYRLSLREGS